ncbi:MAG: LamG domain-containing protein [Campylobacterales bacterium]|nr:LamG domain-containing protein [Campylobacterales bacterium]
MKKIITLIVALFCSVSAYEENFNSYKNGTPLKNLTSEGISYSASGSWEIFTAPFASFTTPVLLEPGKTSAHAPLTLRFSAPQCKLRLTYATDGDDSLIVTGSSGGAEVYRSSFKGSYTGGLYVGEVNVGLKAESVTLTTAGGKKLLIDDIATESCSLDTFALTDGLITHYRFEEATASQTLVSNGKIGKALSLTALEASLILDHPAKEIQSIAFWLYISDAQSGTTVLSTADNASRMQLGINESLALELSLSESFFSPYISSKSLSPRQWHHVVVVRDEEMISVYVDGTLYDTFTTSATLHQANEAVVLHPASGMLLDDLRIYQAPLSAYEVNELYYVRERFAVLADERFEEGKRYCMEHPEACGLRPGRGELDLSVAADVAALSNQTLSFGWYLFSSPDGSTYLAGGDFSNPSIWQLVPGTREWKPVHNAGAFDGFEERGTLFESVTISQDGTQIVFGAPLEANLSDTDQ